MLTDSDDGVFLPELQKVQSSSSGPSLILADALSTPTGPNWPRSLLVIGEPRPKRPAKGRGGKSVPRLQYRMLQALYEEQQPAADAPVVSAQRCSLFELSKERCRWPVNAEAEEFSFCGNTPLAGMPYCSGHTRLAYRSLARRAG